MVAGHGRMETRPGPLVGLADTGHVRVPWASYRSTVAPPRSEPEARSSSVRCLWVCLMSDQEDPPSVIERGTAFVPGSSVVIVAGLDDDNDDDDLETIYAMSL